MMTKCSLNEHTHLIFLHLAPTSLSTTVEPSEYSLGDEVNLTCTWDTLVYYVAWYKDGVLISRENVASGTTLMSPSGVNVTSSYENSRSILTIASASITDTGNYTCAVSCGAEDVVFNMIADDLKSTTLVTVYGEVDDGIYIYINIDDFQQLTFINYYYFLSVDQPRTPNRFTGVNTDLLEITFEWTALKESENGIPRGFPQNLQYTVIVRDSDGTVVSNETVSHPANYTVFSNLPPCTNFTATLVAVNDILSSTETMVVIDTFDSG